MELSSFCWCFSWLVVMARFRGRCSQNSERQKIFFSSNHSCQSQSLVMPCTEMVKNVNECSSAFVHVFLVDLSFSVTSPSIVSFVELDWLPGLTNSWFCIPRWEKEKKKNCDLDRDLTFARMTFPLSKLANRIWIDDCRLLFREERMKWWLCRFEFSIKTSQKLLSSWGAGKA